MLVLRCNVVALLLVLERVSFRLVCTLRTGLQISCARETIKLFSVIFGNVGNIPVRLLVLPKYESDRAILSVDLVTSDNY